MKRVIVPAAAAIAVLVCIAAVVWTVLVRGVAETTAEQGRLAGEFLDSKTSITQTLAATLYRPGIHVLALDRTNGILFDAGSDGVVQHTVPPGAGLPGDAPPAPANDGTAGQNPLGQGPPGQGLPGQGPPGQGPPGGRPGPPPARPQPGALAALAISLAHLHPVRLLRVDRAIEIAPDAPRLGTQLLLVVASLFTTCAIVVALAISRVIAINRAERSELEASIAERREAAERYQRFLADTGHELRTPLTVMTGYVDILRSRTHDAALNDRILEGMHAETARMRVLVEKMMTLARLESESAVPRLLDVGTAARESAQTLRRRYPDRTVKVNAEQTGSIVIDADDFAAALGNLLENAIKYAPESPIEIETTIVGTTITIAVVDHGPGIAPADRQALFDRFYRGRNRTHGEGLGLGLAIVDRIAKRWNGSVDFDSADGRTVFRMTFPLADEVAS